MRLQAMASCKRINKQNDRQTESRERAADRETADLVVRFLFVAATTEKPLIASIQI